MRQITFERFSESKKAESEHQTPNWAVWKTAAVASPPEVQEPAFASIRKLTSAIIAGKLLAQAA